MFFGSKNVLGVDIGSNAVKVAELEKVRRGHQLKNLGEALLPHGAILNKTISKHDDVTETLSGLIDDLRIKTKNAVLSISGHSVIIKKVSLPIMTENELREAIPWEIEQYIPQSIEEVNYDYQVLPGETAEGNMDVLIVAAKKDITNDYISAATQAGLSPVMVDVDVFALENMYEMNYSDSVGILALVNIGAAVTNINVLRDGVSVFTRDVTTGGNQFTEWIMKELSISYEEAEMKKYSFTRGEEKGEELERMAHDFTELICGEIKRTLDFFSSTLWKKKVDKIMLGGGSSKVPYVRQTLEEMTESTVELLNPFKNISYSSSEFDSQYISEIAPKMGVATGLALRRVGDNL